MSKPVWWGGAVYAEEEEGSYLTNARFVQIHLPSNTVGKQFLSRHDATSSDYAQQKQKRMRRNMKTKQKFSFRREKFCLNHLDQKQVSGMSKNHAKNERENDSKKRDYIRLQLRLQWKVWDGEGKRDDCARKKFGNSLRAASAYKYDVIYGIRSCFATCQNEIEHAAPTTRTN